MTPQGYDYEALYGNLWRGMAKAEGHVSKTPSKPAPQKSQSEIQLAILAEVLKGPMTHNGIQEATSLSHKVVQNNLYQMRAAELVHSQRTPAGTSWHSGPKGGTA